MVTHGVGRMAAPIVAVHQAPFAIAGRRGMVVAGDLQMRFCLQVYRNRVDPDQEDSRDRYTNPPDPGSGSVRRDSRCQL